MKEAQPKVVEEKFCDLCKTRIKRQPGSSFVDGRTRIVHFGSSWAFMCLKCFKANGLGLGTGKGQMYSFIKGDWQKVAG